MQIFYPYSIEMYPDEFPGEAPNDCKRDTSKETALELNCINREWADQYGHYREGKLVQIKHHWWWKALRVFAQLEATKDFDGLFLFLEEDFVLVHDFIHLLKLMQSKYVHKDNKIITLTTDPDPNGVSIQGNSDQVGVISQLCN